MKTKTSFTAIALFVTLGITAQTFAENTQSGNASQTNSKAQAKILDHYGAGIQHHNILHHRAIGRGVLHYTRNQAARGLLGYKLQVGLPTNVPGLQTVTKSNTTFTITIVAITAAAATYGSYDCTAVHN